MPDAGAGDERKRESKVSEMEISNFDFWRSVYAIQFSVSCILGRKCASKKLQMMRFFFGFFAASNDARVSRIGRERFLSAAKHAGHWIINYLLV